MMTVECVLIKLVDAKTEVDATNETPGRKRSHIQHDNGIKTWADVGQRVQNGHIWGS